MRERQQIKTRFIALLMLLAFGLSVLVHSIFDSSVLAQAAIASSIEKTISYLVQSTEEFFVNFKPDRTFTIDNSTGRRYSSNFGDQPFDLKDLGRLVFQWRSDVDLPQKIGLTGNQGSGDLFFSLQHELEGVNIPPHLQVKLRGEASDSDFVTQQGKLASIEITFEGLLFKGVPEYLSKTDLMRELIQKYDFKLEAQGDSKATLSKTVALSSEQQELFNRLRDVEARLDEKQQQIQNLRALDSAAPFRAAQIEELKNDLKNYAIEKSNLLSQVFQDIEFPCAPEFKREVKFPIFERSASSSSSNASARAALGVSGNVEMEVRNPTCGISMISPFKFEAWTYADIDITSRGFFGARAEAEASGDIGITFSDKSGHYPVSLEISPEERQAFNGLALKMFDKAKNDQQILISLQEQIDSKAVQISNSIQRELIGDGTNISQICSLFDTLGLRTPSSEEDLICWAFNTASLPAKPKLPNIPLNLLPQPNLPSRPDGQCRAQLPLPPCQVRRERVCGVCERCATILGRRRCVPIPCTDCPEQQIEIPPGCQAARRSTEATNASYRTVCGRIQSWERQVNQLRQNWERRNRTIRDQWERDVATATQEFNRQLAEWTELSDRWNRYRDPVLVLAVANRAINERILRPLNNAATSTIAQHLLDAAWQGVDWIDMTSDFVRTNLPGDLSINVQGSARASLTSRVHLLHARPKFKSSVTLEISPEGQPSLNLVFSGFQNAREDGSGGIGGLDVLGYTLTAEQVLSIGGRKIQQPEYRIEPEGFTPTFDEGKILLSNREEVLYQGSYRYGSGLF